MAWMILILAGVLEVTWAVSLKYTQGFTRPLPTVFTVATIIASMKLLAIASRDLPIGTAYAVWVGIGAFGTAVIGMAFLGEPAGPARVAFLALLLIALIGLKATGA